MEHRIAFLLNPIAGMGGRVGLKGTDDVVDEARRRGAQPVATERAERALRRLRELIDDTGLEIHWIACSPPMGEEVLRRHGITDLEICHHPPSASSAEDSRSAAREFRRLGAEVILFCGGDGTARDLASEIGCDVPLLGIPSGVKMYSGLFGVSPERTAELLVLFLQGDVDTAEVEVLDLDEERYRRGEWVVRLYAEASTPFEASLTQAGKDLLSSADDATTKREIAEQIREEMIRAPEALYLLGPGSTVAAVAHSLGVEGTLLGVDALLAGRLLEADLDERRLLSLLESHPDRRLVLSPIGAQGFVLGRGNQQLSPEVVRRVGLENLVLVATPAKLARTPVLHFDTGDAALDQEIAAAGYLPVIVGYRQKRMVRVRD